MEEEAPPSQRSSTCIWSLIVGPQAGSWAGRLVENYLGPEGRLALFRTCQAARDMVLSTHGYLTLTLALQVGDPACELRRLRVLRPAFQTRGAPQTRLYFKLGCAELWPLTQALGVLEEAGQWLQEVVVENPAGTLPASIVAEIGRSFPNLKCLVIDGHLEAMPDPELFPRLEELYVCPADLDTSLDRLYSTLQPYLPRLERLDVRAMLSPQQQTDNPVFLLPRLPLLFPPIPCPHLKVLHLATKLDDELLGLLLEKLPALLDLTVAVVQLQSDIHAQAECAWQYIECEHGMYLSSLARLPLSEHVHAVIVSALVCDVITDEAQAALQAAATKVTMRATQCVRLKPMRNLDVDLHPAALRVALDMLRTIGIEGDYLPTDRRVDLSHWLLSDHFIRELRGLPHWGSLMLWNWGFPVGHSCMCTTLLRCLPTSFHTVVLPANEPMIEAVCWGAPVDRTAEEPFHIRLYGDADQIQHVMASLQHSVALPHVIVSSDYEQA